ncbi:MAG TPA: ParB/RepB/Spo0J family partition protein [Gemmatimonadaceae bacterium]|nr:ParB/RepB/Spo0J family partition protein [Gemmatimonadaceae bacterium]
MTDHIPADKSRRLGRGLDALIGLPTPPSTPVHPSPPGSAAEPSREAAADSRLRDLPLTLIRPNPFQPRREFDDEELRELEDSLRTNGLLQPVTVRRVGAEYELIAGERRLRAAKRLGWTTIAAVVRDSSDEQSLTLALIENLQREDLNPIDEAEGYQRLSREFSLSQQQIAEAVGKDRSTVANMLRLLTLPDDVQHYVRGGQLSVGHARALLGLPPGASISEVAREVLRRQLTVREVERLAQQGRPAEPKARPRHPQVPADPELRRVADRLRRYLQTDVQVFANEKTQGEVRIRFYSADDLGRLLELIAGPAEDGY